MKEAKKMERKGKRGICPINNSPLEKHNQNKSVHLIVTIDTEEDNWGIHRSGVTVKNIVEVNRLQQLFDKYGIRPTYLVTYQVAKTSSSAEVLRKIQQEGKCEIGAHLHPWNTYPIIESVDNESSMLGNLPIELQASKIKTIVDQHIESFGHMPVTFRAGRWGLRNETVALLAKAGFKVDTSLTPLMNWASEGLRESIRHEDTEPCWFNASGAGKHGKVLEIPVSIGFNRQPTAFWNSIYNHFQKKAYRALRPIGLLYYSKILRKIWLSPELSPPGDMIDLAKKMIESGKTILNFTFHTPSLLAGCGPFVRSEMELAKFYQNIETFLKFAYQHPRIQSSTASDIEKKYSNENQEA